MTQAAPSSSKGVEIRDLPDDWIETTAGSIGSFKGGSGFPVRFQGCKTGELPFYKVSDMNNPGNETFMNSARNYISEVQRDQIGAVLMPQGAIVFAKVGAAVFLERKRILSQPSCIDNNMAAMTLDCTKADVPFMYYKLSDFAMSSLVATGALPSINGGQLRSISVTLPSDLGEQGRIAEALSDADALIRSLEQLISKKRAIKQGMMQELLTGKTRLPGYSGEWVEAKLDDVCLVDPEPLPATTPKSVFIDYISLEDVSKGILLGSSHLLFGDAPSRARRLVRRGDVLFGTVRPNLQSHVHYTGQLTNPVASTGFAVLRPISGCSDSSFIGQWVLSDEAMGQANRIIAGSNYPAVSGSDVRRFDVQLPSVVEQRHIGEALRVADKGIAALEVRLHKVCLVKRGMMQELLTGRTRLMPQGVSA